MNNTRAINRRRLLFAGAGGALALAVAACGEGHSEEELGSSEEIAGAVRKGGGPSAELDGGPKTLTEPTELVGPVGIGQNDERKDIYVVTEDNKLFEFTFEGKLTFWSDGGEQIDEREYPYSGPTDSTYDRPRQLWVLDAGNAQIQKYGLYQGRPEGHLPISVRWGDPDLQDATQLRASGFGFPYIITADERLLRFTAAGTDKTVIESPEPGGLWRGIAVIPIEGEVFGLLWVPDTQTTKLYAVTRVGLDYEIDFATDFDGLVEPGPFSINREEQFYVIEPATDEIHRFEIDGSRSATFGGTGSDEGQLLDPHGLQAGVEGVYVADTGNNRIQHFDADGNFLVAWDGAGT